MSEIRAKPATRRDIPFGRPILGESEKAMVAEVLDGHILTHGPRCTEFENKFAARIGTKFAVTTSSCTTAMHLSLLALGIGPGDEVIVPAETHVATGHAVEHAGARPVFVDVLWDSGNIDPDAVRRAVTPRSRAILPVHFLGLPCDMAALGAIASEHGLAIVEDCAVALGAEYDGVAPGAIGSTGCFSFYPSKHITTMEGGMLTTDDEALAARARKQRAFGYDKGLGERARPGIYDVVMLGYNFRMSEAQAAVGIGQLDRLDGFLAARRRNTKILHGRLAEIDEITLFPVRSGPAESACYCVNAVLPRKGGPDRDDVIAALNAAGVGTSVHYPVAVPLCTYYREKYGYRDADFPAAHWISARSISLPVGPHLDEDDMGYLAETLKGAIAGARLEANGQ